VNLALEQVDIGRLDQIRVLRRLFAAQTGLSTAAVAALAAHVVTVRIPAGKSLHSPDEPVSETYLVVEGELAAQYRAGGPKMFGPPSAVGMLPGLARIHDGYRSWATRDSVALRLRVDDILEVFEDHFELLYSTLRALAGEGVDLRKRAGPHAGFSNVVPEGTECPSRPLDLVERTLCLRRSFGLGHSHIDELAELARGANELRRPAGTQLWAAGDPAGTMLLVVCGSVRGLTPEGQEFQLGAGDIVGGLGMVAEVPRWFEAKVQEDMVALSLQHEVLIDLLEDQPDLGFDFLQLIASTLLMLREKTVQAS
jgi:CRP-like cAMP-binding protein